MTSMHRIIATSKVVIIGFFSLVIISNGENSSSEDSSSPKENCMTEYDVDSKSCNLSDLPIPGLEAICDRVGLNMHTLMFPDMDEERVALGDKLDETRTKADYVEAATQCLLIEQEMERMLEDDPEALDSLEKELLDKDDSMLAEVIADVLGQNAELTKQLEDEIKNDNPELHKVLLEELGEGETLSSRLDILADVVTVMLKDDDTFLDMLEEELMEKIDVKSIDTSDVLDI